MKTTRINPHKERRSSIHFVIVILVLFIVMAAFSCKTQQGCPQIIHKKKFTAFLKAHAGWIKNVETGKVCILAPDGAIVYSYYEPTKLTK